MPAFYVRVCVLYLCLCFMSAFSVCVLCFVLTCCKALYWSECRSLEAETILLCIYMWYAVYHFYICGMQYMTFRVRINFIEKKTKTAA